MKKYEKVKLFEGARWDPLMTYRFNGVATTIAGYTFEGYVLQKRGGDRLLTVPVTNKQAAEGTGKFQPVITQAQVDAFRANGQTPRWFEIYVTIGGLRFKWMDIDLDYRLAGQAVAP